MTDFLNDLDAIEVLKYLKRDLLANSPYDKAVNRAIDALNSVNRWIPCSERLPEDQTRVLIKTIYGSMCIAKRCGNGDWYTDGSGTYHAHEVASWMPLPEEGGEQ